MRNLNWAFALSAVLLVPALGMAGTIVVPNGNANSPGNSDGNEPASPVPFIAQILIDPNQFPAGPIDITGLSFRALPGGGPVDESFGNASLSLSTSPNFANSTSGPLMSTTFANNIGPGGLTQVYSGTNVTLSDAGCSGPGVCPFDLSVSFTTPFLYNRANGSLLVELVASGFVGTGDTDAVEFGAPGGPIANVYESGSTTATTGTLNLGDSIIQLTYTSASPEPASWTMAVAGVLLLFWIGRRRQSRAHPRRFSML
jgi:hypothetical protein